MWLTCRLVPLPKTWLLLEGNSPRRFKAKFRVTISGQIIFIYGHREFVIHKCGHGTYIKENCRYPITSFVGWKGSICVLVIIKTHSSVTIQCLTGRCKKCTVSFESYFFSSKRSKLMGQFIESYVIIIILLLN